MEAGHKLFFKLKPGERTEFSGTIGSTHQLGLAVSFYILSVPAQKQFECLLVLIKAGSLSIPVPLR